MTVNKITTAPTQDGVINKINEIIDNLGGGSITVDNSLSTTSTNPVQNKVITSVISDMSASVNMDEYLDMIISGDYNNLPFVIQSSYSSDLSDIIDGTYT